MLPSNGSQDMLLYRATKGSLAIGATLSLLLPHCSTVRVVWQRTAAIHFRYWNLGCLTQGLLSVPDKKLSYLCKLSFSFINLVINHLLVSLSNAWNS